MKQSNFKMKKLCSAKHFKPWLLMNTTDQQWENSQKKASYLYDTVSYSILSTKIDIVKLFCVLHNKVALLTQIFWAGNKKLPPNNF